MTDRPFFARLKNRGIVKISGADGRSFLQGLISNDVNLLDRQPIVYACLLTPQGKFQYDFFLSQDGDALVLECEGGKRAYDLAKLLGLYKLRTNITIEVNDSVPVYAVFGQAGPLPDPRHPLMGSRTFEIPKGLEEKPFEAWDDVRIRLCIPDGSRDMVPGQSTLLECGIDRLNGVSFDKGCYMGQELTARTHYRGLIKKHLYTVEADSSHDSLADSGTEIKIDGRIVGEMRSSCGRIGLAMLKDEAVEDINASSLMRVLKS